MSAAQGEDVLRQRELFDLRREDLEHEFPGKVVGFVADQRIVVDDTALLLDTATELYGRERQVYFEPIAVAASQSDRTSVKWEPDRVWTDGSARWQEVLLERSPELARAPRLLFRVLRVVLLAVPLLGIALGLARLAGVRFAGQTLSEWALVASIAVLVTVGVLSRVYRLVRARIERRRAQKERTGVGPR